MNISYCPSAVNNGSGHRSRSNRFFIDHNAVMFFQGSLRSAQSAIDYRELRRLVANEGYRSVGGKGDRSRREARFDETRFSHLSSSDLALHNCQ